LQRNLWCESIAAPPSLLLSPSSSLSSLSAQMTSPRTCLGNNAGWISLLLLLLPPKLLLFPSAARSVAPPPADRAAVAPSPAVVAGRGRRWSMFGVIIIVADDTNNDDTNNHGAPRSAGRQNGRPSEINASVGGRRCCRHCCRVAALHLRRACEQQDLLPPFCWICRKEENKRRRAGRGGGTTLAWVQAPHSTNLASFMVAVGRRIERGRSILSASFQRRILISP
jgi:hypothetical protein